MKKILLSILTISAVAALGWGASSAFFSDEETSTGNILVAGAIDLLVDNESYYNGEFSNDTSWLEPTDLTNQLFFAFRDLKPGDYGEDTISLHVDNNDSWVCADVTLTSNNENGIVDPEDDDGDVTDDPDGGELANRVNFIWWADDGDNVLEEGEEALPGGPLGVLGVGGTATVPLADSQTNIWDEENAPLPGDSTQYVGKAWCFGTIAAAALPDGDYPEGPAGDNNDNQTPGEPEDGGVTCDGSAEDNQTQTDSFTADISFRAVQSRHNEDFLCNPVEITPTISE